MTGSKSHNQAIDHSQKSTPIVIYLTCSLIATVILLIDIWIPLGVAAGVPYIIVVLISLKSPENRFTIIVALTCTLFVGIGYLASPSAPDYVPFYQIATNRSLSIAAIWVVAIMALIQRNRNDELHQMQLRNLESMKEAEIQKERLKILKATMRTVQDITGNFLNNLQHFTFTIEKNKTLSPDSIKKLDELIHDTAQRINKLGNLEEVREKKMTGDMIGIDYEYPKKNAADSRATIDKE
jgi:hypothetical protein